MTLRLNGDSSGFTEIKAADAAGDNSIKLPASNGSANQLLQNGGTAGELQYTNAGGGLHYDSSGRLLVGHGSDLAPDGFQSKIQSIAIDYRSSILARREGNNASGTVLNFVKTRSTTIGGNTIVQDGDMLGGIQFYGADGTNSDTPGAFIRSNVDGSPGSDVMPASISFWTNGGGSSVTERIKIGSNGALKLLAGCPGIDFSGIQTNAAGMTSETLDSYEEGTWTPVGANNFNGITNADGAYVKVGKIVWISFQFNYSSLDNSAGSSAVSGLPFNPGNANPNTGIEATGIVFGTNKLVLSTVQDGANILYFETNRPLYGSASTGSDFFRGSLVYSI